MKASTALITGASRGLGEALSAELARAGTRVVMVARGAEELARAAERIRAAGGAAFPIAADVGDAAGLDALVAQAHALVGPIELLVNNASTLGPTPLELLLDTSSEELARVLEVNVLGPFRLAQKLVPPMLLRGRGLVLNISSDASVEPYPHWGAYGASKAALDHLGRILAAELEGSGVRVLMVDPGEMDTRMHADAVPEADRSTLAHPAEVARRIVAMIGDRERARNGARLQAPHWHEVAS